MCVCCVTQLYINSTLKFEIVLNNKRTYGTGGSEVKLSLLMSLSNNVNLFYKKGLKS